MAENYNIPKEKFRFVQENERIHDKKFEDKPIGYFKDAWIRFRKSRASVAAAIIIVLIIIFSFLAPALITTHDNSFMVSQYARKPARVPALRDSIGIMDGGVERTVSEAELIRLTSMGVGAANYDGNQATLEDGLADYHQPVMEISDPIVTLDARK
jgi:oligopeptide transport system permease protein